MHPKSKKKPPSAMILGNESRRWRETAGDPRDAEIRRASSQLRALVPPPTYKPSLRGSDDDDCVDDEDWFYTTKEGDVFTCDRVAEKTKRCTIRFSEDGVRADEACKKTCGTCP